MSDMDTTKCQEANVHLANRSDELFSCYLAGKAVNMPTEGNRLLQILLQSLQDVIKTENIHYLPGLL